MVFSEYVKQRILYYRRSGKNYAEIVRCLSEGHKATKVGVYKFLRRYEETGTISRNPGSGQASKMTTNAKQIIEDQMCKDDETTGCELKKLLSKDDIHVSARTTLRWRRQLGWTSKGTSYCQMIRDVNKEKRLAWAIQNMTCPSKMSFFQMNLLSKLKLTGGPAAIKEGKSPDTSQSRNILSKYTFGRGLVIEGAQICAYLRGR